MLNDTDFVSYTVEMGDVLKNYKEEIKMIISAL